MNEKLWACALLLALSSNAVLLTVLLFSPQYNNLSQTQQLSAPPGGLSDSARRFNPGGVNSGSVNSVDHPPDTGWLHLDARFRVDRNIPDTFFSNFQSSDASGLASKTPGDENVDALKSYNSKVQSSTGNDAKQSHISDLLNFATSDVLKNSPVFNDLDIDSQNLKELLAIVLPPLSNILRALQRKESDAFKTSKADTSATSESLIKLLLHVINKDKRNDKYKTGFERNPVFDKTTGASSNPNIYKSDPSDHVSIKKETSRVKREITDNSVFVPNGAPWGTGSPTKINYIHATPEKYGMEPVFSAFTEQTVEQLTKPNAEIVLPALVQFEAIVYRQLDGLHSALVHQELRLGRIEQIMNSLEQQFDSIDAELQADAEDNKTGLKINDIIGEGFQLVGNESGFLEVIGEGSGSVDDWTLPTFTTTPATTTTTTPNTTTTTTEATTEATTTTTTTTTTTPMYFIFIDQMREEIRNLSYRFASVDQRMGELHNFKTLAEAELMHARSEVIKMDDKVTELERKQRNNKVRTTMQNYKLTELDMYMGRSELTMQAAMETFNRMTDRFDNFKDKMSDFKDEVHKITSKFQTHQQISNELRTADSHKAHDIQDIRKTIMALQSQFNDLYRVVDEGTMNVRNEIMLSVERICSLNDLMC